MARYSRTEQAVTFGGSLAVRLAVGQVVYVDNSSDMPAGLSQVVVEKTKQNAANEEAAIKEQEAVFQEFCEELPESDCRYAVFDLLVETSDGRTFAKIFFIAWSPDGAKIKNKMLYASSKEKFKSMLPNIQLEKHLRDARHRKRVLEDTFDGARLASPPSVLGIAATDDRSDLSPAWRSRAQRQTPPLGRPVGKGEKAILLHTGTHCTLRSGPCRAAHGRWQPSHASRRGAGAGTLCQAPAMSDPTSVGCLSKRCSEVSSELAPVNGERGIAS
eukprot:scaffold1306_cov399-Prasinococcus_capsulatus_cf.AAC.10